jgi:malate dehydrogenase (oxaloacetate-decarboxylating)(NADP+)|tara:strand:+ start:253 stop:438 length:186 start_codon:yes stop_codon:yes gene_type:complete
MAEDLREATLRYHREPKPDKIEVVSPKPLGNQRDLALAYMLGTARSIHILPPRGQRAVFSI